jgi:DNA-binding transcriptional ArsR family regulator
METISPAERQEIRQMRYEYLLDLGWDAETAKRLASSNEPLRPPSAKAEPSPSTVPNGTVAKPKRTDAASNERRMREALLKDDKLKPNGWTGSGVRKLARQAGMPHGTARHTLDRMEDDGQVERDRRIGKRGNRHGFRVRLEHPCWSEPEMAHLLARSPLSMQVDG